MLSCQCLQARLTSGVSYVIASASRQLGAVPGLPCLPHIVIRPPYLGQSQSEVVRQNVDMLRSEVSGQELLHATHTWGFQNSPAGPWNLQPVLGTCTNVVRQNLDKLKCQVSALESLHAVLT